MQRPSLAGEVTFPSPGFSLNVVFGRGTQHIPDVLGLRACSGPLLLHQAPGEKVGKSSFQIKEGEVH